MQRDIIGRSTLSSVITGSDAQIIIGIDQQSLLELWKRKRAEAAPLDHKNDLVSQLDIITKHLHRRLYESARGYKVQDVRRPIRHPIHKWMIADVEGRVRDTGAIFLARYVPAAHLSNSDFATAWMAQLQHSMWVTAARSTVFSIITGDGKWISTTVVADPLYQHLLLTAEKKFLRCVQTGEPPSLFGIETPKATLLDQSDLRAFQRPVADSRP